MKLRYYQAEAVESPFDYWQEKRGNHPVIAMPTGSGKSLVIADFNRRAVQQYPHTRILNLTHSKELVSQNHSKMLECWSQAPAGILSAGLKRRDFGYPITFAGIGSIHKHAEKFRHTNLITVDECHRIGTHEKTIYQKFIKELRGYNSKLKIVGLTATPYRMGQGMICEPGGMFDDICYDLTSLEAFNRLLDEGYLCPLIPKQTKTELDVSDVKITSGDYNLHDLQAAVDKESVTRGALEEMVELGKHRKSWLIFASGIEHSVHVAQMLGSMGISAVAVHSDTKQFPMSEEQRDSYVEAFKRGEIQALVNNGCFTTGFDHPDIDLIGMLRPTQSPGLWIQMLGRGTRPVWPDGFGTNWHLWNLSFAGCGGVFPADLSTNEGRLWAIANGPKPNCLVLDFARNTPKLGPVNDPRIPNKKKKGGGDAPVKLCEGCDTWNHTSARFCIQCQLEFPPPKLKILTTAATDVLISRGKRDKVQPAPEQIDFEVDLVTYATHDPNVSRWRSNINLPISFEVTYSCGLRKFTERIHLENKGEVTREFARSWWRRASTGNQIPESVEEAHCLASQLKPAVRIRVHVNKIPKPEIIFRHYE